MKTVGRANDEERDFMESLQCAPLHGSPLSFGESAN